MELAFLWFGKQLVLPEVAEYFSDVLLVGFHILGVNEDVIEVDHYANIQHVGEDSIDEVLESCWCVSEAEGHD